MGEGKCYFGGGSLPLYIVDANTYQRRKALKEDMVNLALGGDECAKLTL